MSATTTTTSQTWLDALAELWPIPTEFRDAQVDRIVALDMLRCGEAVLAELVAAGLPCIERHGTQFFDRYDLFNLALASGSGTSVPERAICYALRWMSGGPETWIAPLRWTFDIELDCPAGDCGSDARWSHARLQPEAAGGELVGFVTKPDAELSADRVVFTGRGPVQLSGSLVTRGEFGTLVSSRLRAIVDYFLAEVLAWVR